jgi:hypothetical protein
MNSKRISPRLSPLNSNNFKEKVLKCALNKIKIARINNRNRLRMNPIKLDNKYAMEVLSQSYVEEFDNNVNCNDKMIFHDNINVNDEDYLKEKNEILLENNNNCNIYLSNIGEEEKDDYQSHIFKKMMMNDEAILYFGSEDYEDMMDRIIESMDEDEDDYINEPLINDHLSDIKSEIDWLQQEIEDYNENFIVCPFCKQNHMKIFEENNHHLAQCSCGNTINLVSNITGNNITIIQLRYILANIFETHEQSGCIKNDQYMNEWTIDKTDNNLNFNEYLNFSFDNNNCLQSCCQKCGFKKKVLF